MDVFKDKLCIVTGAGSGIGRATCELLLERGARVFALDINEAALEHLQAPDDGYPENLRKAAIDVTDAGAVTEFLQSIILETGVIDYLFNIAGITIAGEARNLTLDNWRKVIDVNLNGVINSTVIVYKQMVEQGHGHIVNMASVQGLVPLPLEAPYVTSKYAVVGLSQALRIEGQDLGVKVSVVCPGMVETPLFDSPMVNIPRHKYEDYVKSWKRFAVSPQTCAEIVLRGTQKNQPIIPVTFMAKLMWLIGRVSPSWINGLLASDLRKLREALR